MADRRMEEQIAEQAEHWLVHLESGEATPDDHARFEAWLAADPAHRRAYDGVLSLCQGIAGMKHLAALEPVRGRAKVNGARSVFLLDGILRGVRTLTRPPWRPALLGSALVAVFAIFSTTWMLREAPEPATTEYVTSIAEIRALTLEDGSSVTLGARSRIAVRFTGGERRVVLAGGEAFFAVAKDPNRPFLVEVGDTLVRVIGTRFNVHTGPDRVTVAVVEGEVEVIKPKAHPLPFIGEDRSERLRVGPGQQVVSARRGDLEEVRPVEIDKLASWRLGQLVYDDVPLREVISDANRYSARRITIASEDLGDLAVTAAFGTDQIDQMLDGLAALLPITVDRKIPGQVVLKSNEN